MSITTLLFERVDAERVRMVILESEYGYPDRSVRDIVESLNNKWLARLAIWEAENTSDVVVFMGKAGDYEAPLNEFDTGRATKLESRLIRMMEQI